MPSVTPGEASSTLAAPQTIGHFNMEDMDLVRLIFSSSSARENVSFDALCWFTTNYHYPQCYKTRLTSFSGITL